MIQYLFPRKKSFSFLFLLFPTSKREGGRGGGGGGRFRLTQLWGAWEIIGDPPPAEVDEREVWSCDVFFLLRSLWRSFFFFWQDAGFEEIVGVVGLCR